MRNRRLDLSFLARFPCDYQADQCHVFLVSHHKFALPNPNKNVFYFSDARPQIRPVHRTNAYLLRHSQRSVPIEGKRQKLASLIPLSLRKQNYRLSFAPRLEHFRFRVGIIPGSGDKYKPHIRHLFLGTSLHCFPGNVFTKATITKTPSL